MHGWDAGTQGHEIGTCGHRATQVPVPGTQGSHGQGHRAQGHRAQGHRAMRQGPRPYPSEGRDSEGRYSVRCSAPMPLCPGDSEGRNPSLPYRDPVPFSCPHVPATCPLRTHACVYVPVPAAQGHAGASLAHISIASLRLHHASHVPLVASLWSHPASRPPKM
jgi:hypothetical protein